MNIYLVGYLRPNRAADATVVYAQSVEEAAVKARACGGDIPLDITNVELRERDVDCEVTQ
jgi:hypothetical protein